MKKMILLVFAGLMCTGMLAQTKTAYVDVYVRGGGQHMKMSLMYDGNICKLYGRRSNMGMVLSVMGANGWVLDQSVSGLRPYADVSWWTRHKTHLIMKKEYTDVDPYEGLRSMFDYKYIKAVWPKSVGSASNTGVQQSDNSDVDTSVVNFGDESSWEIRNYTQAKSALSRVQNLIRMKNFDAAQVGLKQLEAWYTDSGLVIPAFEEAWNEAQRKIDSSAGKSTK